MLLEALRPWLIAVIIFKLYTLLIFQQIFQECLDAECRAFLDGVFISYYRFAGLNY